MFNFSLNPMEKKRKVRVERGKALPALEGTFMLKDRAGDVLLCDAFSVTGRKYGVVILKARTIERMEYVLE